MIETPAVFGLNRELIGVWTAPDRPSSHPALLMLNAGMVHRVGPGRLYVELARTVAKLGYPSLRFDFSGVGDSPISGATSPLHERALCEARQAIDVIAERYGHPTVIPLGLCSGADVANALLDRDPRVVAAILLNPNLFSAHALPSIEARARARGRLRYYRRSALRLESWRRLITGASDSAAIRRTLSALVLPRARPAHVPTTTGQPEAEMFRRSIQTTFDVLAVFSEGSVAWDLLELQYGSRGARLACANIRTELFRNCDHVFTLACARARLIALVREWLSGARAWNLEATTIAVQ